MAEKKSTEKKSQEKTFKKGDRVSWSSSGGAATGKVVKKATADGKIEDFDYKASKEEPKYIVETDDGTRAAHKAESLKKAGGK